MELDNTQHLTELCVSGVFARGGAGSVGANIDGRQLSIRYPMEVNLIGDSKQTLRALDAAVDGYV